jgi:NitT/TauT family transport system substrate-binding protein
LLTFSYAGAQTKSLRPFTFILDFLPYGEYTPYFAALDKGWYKEEGLDVKILRGAGSADTEAHRRGQGDAGCGDFSALVAGRANEDIKVKGIAAISVDHPIRSLCWPTQASTNQRTWRVNPFDNAGQQSLDYLPSLCTVGWFNADSVKWVTMDGAAMGPALITGRVDGAPFFANHEARLQKQAREQGKAIRRISYADYGLDMYSLVVFAREESIAKEPDALRAFLRATIRGMMYVFANKNFEEGAKCLIKYNPEVDLEAATGASQVASRYSFTEEVTSGKVAVGQFEPARVEKSRDIYTKYLNLKRKVPGGDLHERPLTGEK